MILEVVSPVDQSVYAQRRLATEEEVEHALVRARKAFEEWRRVPLDERRRRIEQGLQSFQGMSEHLVPELAWQMGRPVRYGPGEVRGFLERGRAMLELAPEGLAPVRVEDGRRYIAREPLGLVLTIAAWNYPYLIAVNSIVPALLAGNSVILKHSAQTPLCGERIVQAFEEHLPEGALQFLHLDHAQVNAMIADPRVDFVAFTGSVEGGRAVSRAAAGRFIGLGLELGGKDPAYVRADADLGKTVESLVDGAFFNSGQSCCGIERIYVHHSLYDEFVEGFVHLTREYRLGNPLDPETTMGPMVRTAAAEAVRAQIRQAVSQGARAWIPESHFPLSREGTPYMAPQVLTGVAQSMDVMRLESFGPVVGIMAITSDEEAVRLMNDSSLGLTASVWTRDLEAARRLGEELETGTVFANRCDYLDPYLAWTGVKDSGRGCALSRLGFEQLTRPKSYHLRPVA